MSPVGRKELTSYCTNSVNKFEKYASLALSLKVRNPHEGVAALIKTFIPLVFP